MKHAILFELSADRWFIWNIKVYSSWNSKEKSCKTVIGILSVKFTRLNLR